jgi:hypothetical protein
MVSQTVVHEPPVVCHPLISGTRAYYEKIEQKNNIKPRHTHHMHKR